MTQRQELLQEILRPPDEIINYDKLVEFRKPVVYAWCRGDAVLYIGSGINGLTRPFDRSHHQLWDFQPGDELLIWRFDDPVIAQKCERSLIINVQPMRNKALTGHLTKKRLGKYEIGPIEEQYKRWADKVELMRRSLRIAEATLEELKDKYEARRNLVDQRIDGCNGDN